MLICHENWIMGIHKDEDFVASTHSGHVTLWPKVGQYSAQDMVLHPEGK